jgi:hypothetical protein
MVRLEENTLPVVTLGGLCDFFFCSPDNWLDGVFLLPPTGSCSVLGWMMYSLSRGTPWAGDRPRTTSSGKVACSLPRRGRTAGIYGTELYMPLP